MTDSSESPRPARAPGSLLVVSAPSGAGKTSLVRALVDREPALVVSVSHTTRAPRPGERDGEHYCFVDETEFLRLVDADAFLEHAEVFGHRYGTTSASVDASLSSGRDVILEIDWQGARQVRSRHPEAVGVFILPPSLPALESRLGGRRQDSAEVVARRMQAAVSEISHYDEFDYVVVNDVFEDAVRDMQYIVRATRLRTARQQARHGALIRSLVNG
ncbi:MAG: guanylate kinase [Ectothiorhodospiraceae bacterium]|nr:guanylate kinase [Chromatiales bacterium]MCP5153576.1 guanylate kinase [Ectothiorhodospiraceae bacterium]